MYDDFGNHIGIPPTQRTYERRMGCWNCTSANASDLYRNRVQDCYKRDMATYLERGLPMRQAHAKSHATRQLLLDKAGIFILCLKGKAPGDFVGCKHLCEDGWSGVTGVIGGLTPGQAYDEPVAALYDEHGQKMNADGVMVVDAGSEPNPEAERARAAAIELNGQRHPIILDTSSTKKDD